MQVILSKEAQKQYNRLPNTEQKKVQRKLIFLPQEIYVGKKLSGELINQRSLRVWPYRIIYIFNKEKQRIEVSSIIHRQGAYK